MTTAVWADPHVRTWSRWLLDSYAHWTGQSLIARSGEPEDEARALFLAPCVILSHGVEPDPIINYGNQAALELWDTTWDRLTHMPSRLTAEPVERQERDRMLATAKSLGFFDGYRGVRITSAGRRFQVEQALIWTVRDDDGSIVGQAASFSQWTFL